MDFFKKNINILFYYFIWLAGVFASVTIMPTLLTANYAINTEAVSYGASFFIIAFTIGTIYFTNYVDKKHNIIKVIILLLVMKFGFYLLSFGFFAFLYN